MPRPTHADTIFNGGRVWTGSPDGRVVEAVAVRDGLIVAAGGAADVADWRGPRTEEVDIGRGLLLPAFQDSHCHPLWGGLAELSCDLSDGSDPKTWLESVARYASAHPELEVISGEGWDPYPFEGGWPDREQLDAVVPDRPVVLLSQDGHSVWANSRALELAGVDAGTADPPRGRIRRDGAGLPTGILHESARVLVQALVPPPDGTRLAEGLRRGQAYLQRLGIGAWLDAWIDPVVAAEPEAAYLDLLGAGELTGRAMLALRWDASRGLEQVEELQERCRTIEAAGGPLVQAKAVKLFVDGVIESSTAFLLAPYHDRSSADAGGVGDPLYEPETLRSIAVALHQAGFDLHLHAIGDGAVRCALDAIEAARQAGPARDARHTIAHLEMVDDDDIERFAALDAIAAGQPLWAVHDETDLILSDRLDAHRLERRYPFGRLRDAGATLALGSDWNVSTADPLRILHVATTRTPPGRPDAAPLGPARERLTLEEGLLAYTAGSARVNRLEATCAHIAVGKAADLVLLDHDPVARGVPLTDCRVVMTMVDGRVVYAR